MRVPDIGEKWPRTWRPGGADPFTPFFSWACTRVRQIARVAWAYTCPPNAALWRAGTDLPSWMESALIEMSEPGNHAALVPIYRFTDVLVLSPPDGKSTRSIISWNESRPSSVFASSDDIMRNFDGYSQTVNSVDGYEVRLSRRVCLNGQTTGHIRTKCRQKSIE